MSSFGCDYAFSWTLVIISNDIPKTRQSTLTYEDWFTATTSHFVTAVFQRDHDLRLSGSVRRTYSGIVEVHVFVRLSTPLRRSFTCWR